MVTAVTNHPSTESSFDIPVDLPPTASSTTEDDFITIDPRTLAEQLLKAHPLQPQRILVSSDSVKNITDSLTEVGAEGGFSMHPCVSLFSLSLARLARLIGW